MTNIIPMTLPMGLQVRNVNDFYTSEINVKVALENGKLVDHSTAIEESIQRYLRHTA